MTRPDYDTYFMSLVKAVAARGTCSRRKVGAIVVNQKNRIVASGYNGAPPGARHCNHEAYANPEDDPDLYQVDGRWSCVRAIHSEANTIAYAASEGIALGGLRLYCDTFPCFNCFKQIVTTGIIEVVYQSDYVNDVRVTALADEVRLTLRRFTA
jgi:dCMP deaminase